MLQTIDFFVSSKQDLLKIQPCLIVRCSVLPSSFEHSVHFYRSYCSCENFFIFLGMAAPGQLWELPVNTDMTLTIDLVRGVCSVFRGGTCMCCLLSRESIKLSFQKKKKRLKFSKDIYKAECLLLNKAGLRTLNKMFCSKSPNIFRHRGLSFSSSQFIYLYLLLYEIIIVSSVC